MPIHNRTFYKGVNFCAGGCGMLVVGRICFHCHSKQKGTEHPQTAEVECQGKVRTAKLIPGHTHVKPSRFNFKM